MSKYILLAVLLTILGGSACKKEQSANDLPLENSHWRLQKLIKNNEIKVVPSTIVVTAAFNAGQLTGSGGCNEYQATYTTDGDQLTINLITSTLKYCVESGELEATYYNTLQTSQSWEVDGSTLKIQTADTLLIFEEQ